MSQTALSCLPIIVIGLVSMESQAEEFHPPLQEYVAARVAEVDEIPTERKAELQKLANYIEEKLAANQPIKMTFICTHNSRRSHMGQLWSAVAAKHYGIKNFQSFSGGTEATAFNPRAVAAMKRAGMEIEEEYRVENPLYLVKFSPDDAPQTCFSKVFDKDPNPESGFCAVMTCSSADKACPIVQGADERVAIPYEDPKVADNTPEEAAKYDERSRQIAREMLYLFSQVEK